MVAKNSNSTHTIRTDQFKTGFCVVSRFWLVCSFRVKCEYIHRHFIATMRKLHSFDESFSRNFHVLKFNEWWHTLSVYCICRLYHTHTVIDIISFCLHVSMLGMYYLRTTVAEYTNRPKIFRNVATFGNEHFNFITKTKISKSKSTLTTLRAHINYAFLVKWHPISNIMEWSFGFICLLSGSVYLVLGAQHWCDPVGVREQE